MDESKKERDSMEGAGEEGEEEAGEGCGVIGENFFWWSDRWRIWEKNIENEIICDYLSWWNIDDSLGSWHIDYSLGSWKVCKWEV